MSDSICTNPTQQSVLNRASKDKFLMVLTLPKIMRELSPKDPLIDIDSLQMSVWGAVIPDISVPHVELPFGGQHANVASHTRPNYPPLTLDFIVDNDYKNYYVLWKWLHILNSPRESFYQGNPRGLSPDINDDIEYQTTFSIFALNEYNEAVMQFNYYNCFIIRLGGIKFSYKEGDIIETTVDFKFNQFDLNKPKTPSIII